MAIVGVVADDLTGANDTAVQFSKQGLRAVVSLGADVLSARLLSADVAVLDTASRELSPGAAAAACRVAVASLRECGVSLLYKKIDSTLRGHVAEEIAAALDAFSPGGACLVAPAFPALQRVTIGGYQLTGQQLAAHSLNGPLDVAHRAHVPTMLAAVVGDAVGHLSLLDVRQGAQQLEEMIRARVASGQRFLAADALDDHDLQHVARAFRSAGVGTVIVGSGGLASVVPSVWSMRRRQQWRRSVSAPVVVLAGSLHPTTRRQLATLASQQYAPHWIHLNVSALSSNSRCGAEQERVIGELLIKLLCGNDVAVSSSQAGTTPVEPPRGPEGMRLREVINATFGIIARQVVEAEPSTGLVLTGGDVAEAVLRELGVEGMAIEDEVQPGIPFGRCVAGPFEGLRVVSKAGGFGADTALADALRFLREEARHHDRDRQQGD